ncbi:MAG: RNA methyltransferase [Draconibacterium sp.]|nr:MAG: RNA methyltransferase [Draconibacterium sp.]
MISKNTIKLVKSLAYKKYREKEQLFVAEGDKIVTEIMNSGIHIEQLYATREFLDLHTTTNNPFISSIGEIKKQEIERASLLKNPQNCLAICKLPQPKLLPSAVSGISIYLDGIQDPGNLGSIIRICDWFAIDHLFCSTDTADMYNPRVIQATMGSFCRVRAQKASNADIATLINNSKLTVYGAMLDGDSIYSESFSFPAMLIIGNEGNGIRNDMSALVNKKLTIPSFRKGAESLNAAMATAILCSEFRRGSYSK